VYKRILVAVDGSSTSLAGLKEAIGLAELTGARIRLIHVVDELSAALQLDENSTRSGDWLNMLKEGGAKILRQAESVVAADGIPVDTRLDDRFGERLGTVVANEAQEWKADLVVTGTHGRRGVSRMLLGSDAEGILRLSPVPVLLVRSPELNASA
jgi:nucleotide-binding universal stress UspA family protein